MEPSSRSVCNSRRRSLMGASSVYCSSAARARVRRMNLNPEIGANSRSSIKSMSVGGAAFQLQTNVHEVIRRPRAGVLEIQAVPKLSRDAIDCCIELNFALPFDQERRIHDHLVAD